MNNRKIIFEHKTNGTGLTMIKPSIHVPKDVFGRQVAVCVKKQHKNAIYGALGLKISTLLLF